LKGSYIILYCDFCRRPNIDLRRLQRDEGEKGYILSCKACESEKGLEKVPTYELSDLEKFFKQRRRDPLLPTIIKTDDGSEYVLFHNGSSDFLKRDELKLIADEIYKTLELDDSLDEFIEEKNIKNNLKHFYSYSEKDREKFQIPYDRLRLSKRYFDPDKNKWGFRCGNCSGLINIDVQESYFTIVPEYIFDADIDRGCSKGCTKVILKDIVKNWLHNNECQYFYIDDLDEEIIDVIRKA